MQLIWRVNYVEAARVDKGDFEMSKLNRIQLIVSNISYGPEPAASDDVAQRVTVTAEGDVSYEVHQYGGDVTRRRLQVDRGQVMQLFGRLDEVFRAPSQHLEITDVGRWQLTRLQGTTETVYTGALIEDSLLAPLSAQLRVVTGLSELWGFTGDDSVTPDVAGDGPQPRRDRVVE